MSPHPPCYTASWPRDHLQHAQLRRQRGGKEADRERAAGNPLGDRQGGRQSQEAGRHRCSTHMPGQSYGSRSHQTVRQPFLNAGKMKNNNNGHSFLFPLNIDFFLSPHERYEMIQQPGSKSPKIISHNINQYFFFTEAVQAFAAE